MMLERDLQDYLFNNPELLFPGETITEKTKEFRVGGKRIDLLFVVGGLKHIVELKRDSIEREHIGQIIEYYGLMRQAMPAAEFRMILVAPSIPSYRRVFLEELGIRCIEIKETPTSDGERNSIKQMSLSEGKRQRVEQEIAELLPDQATLRFGEIIEPTTRRSLAISQLALRRSLEAVHRDFAGYEVLPIKMISPHSHDVLCVPSLDGSSVRFQCGGAWWAYRFGHSESMPKNDVPNISVVAMPWGLDVTVNAELQPSQRLMRKRVAASPKAFEALIETHGDLQLQAWLKLEHQPRFYHWILLTTYSPGTWGARDLLAVCERTDQGFDELRSTWITKIRAQRTDLSAAQSAQLERRNTTVNLALRIVRCFGGEDVLWTLPFPEQLDRLNAEYRNLRPLIDFFQ